ncbi:MAG TPA: hypothetical protein VHJ17_18355 [Thermomonospora sp.]|nr:hypothetical protein [Thermomonospora sp.]
MTSRLDDPPGPSGDIPPVVGLGEPPATRRACVGDAAALLARAREQGLPVPDGFVVTVQGVGLIAEEVRRVAPALRLAWQALQGPVLLRMSSRTAHGESRGGGPEYFDATTWEGMLDGVNGLLLHDRLENPGRRDEPWGLLVLRRPLTLRSVLVITGDPFGTGEEIGLWRAEDDPASAGPRLRRRDRRMLRDLARRARAVAGGPIDMEVAIDVRDRPWVVDLRRYQHPPWR